MTKLRRSISANCRSSKVERSSRKDRRAHGGEKNWFNARWSPGHSLYDTPGSLVDYTDRRVEPWQSNDGMELRLVHNDEKGDPKTGAQSSLTIRRTNPLTIGPKFHTLESSADDGSHGSGSANSQQHVWKYMLGLVVLSFLVSVVAAILASVALNNAGESSMVGERLLPARQSLLESNFSGTSW